MAYVLITIALSPTSMLTTFRAPFATEIANLSDYYSPEPLPTKWLVLSANRALNVVRLPYK